MKDNQIKELKGMEALFYPVFEQAMNLTISQPKQIEVLDIPSERHIPVYIDGSDEDKVIYKGEVYGRIPLS